MNDNRQPLCGVKSGELPKTVDDMPEDVRAHCEAHLAMGPKHYLAFRLSCHCGCGAIGEDGVFSNLPRALEWLHECVARGVPFGSFDIGSGIIDDPDFGTREHANTPEAKAARAKMT